MTDNHPITSPPELLAQWEDDILDSRDNVDYVLDCAWRNGFQAGADQELEACCKWVNDDLAYDVADRLRTARRPKPPSLKAQALKELNRSVYSGGAELSHTQVDFIRCALEQLPDTH